MIKLFLQRLSKLIVLFQASKVANILLACDHSSIAQYARSNHRALQTRTMA